MVEDPPDRDIGLARRRELRPVARHRLVPADQPPIHRHRGTQGRHRLGDRHHADQRVLRPRARAGAVREAAPEIDDRRAPQGDGDGGAGLAARAEILRERIGERGEAPVAMAGDRRTVR